MLNRILIVSGIVISIIILVIFGVRIYTKSFSPESSASYKSSKLNIDVDYCRPSKKDRDIFGGLIKFGEVWRTGANEATMIDFSNDVSIGGKQLKAGKYSLFTIPQKDQWTVIFNEQTGQWGTVYNEDMDELRIEVPVQEPEDIVETFTINFREDGDQLMMVMKWDDALVQVPINTH